MIEEIKLNSVSNTLPTINKKSPPRSINSDLTACYFSACFSDSRGTWSNGDTPPLGAGSARRRPPAV